MPPDTNIRRRSFLEGAVATVASPILTGQAGGSAENIDFGSVPAGGRREVIVVFRSRSAVDRLADLQIAEGYYSFKQLPFGYAKLTGEQLRRVAGWSDVEYVQENHDIEFHNDDARDVTGVQAVHEQLGYTGGSVHVVVIDSGIDGDHPDFEETLRHNFRFTNPLETEMWRDVGPVDTASRGHGTHVSGSIAGEGTVSDGTLRGMAPDADLTVYSTDAGIGLLGVVGAYDDAIDRQKRGVHSIQLVNNSWGGPVGNDYTPDGTIQRATWAAYRLGILSVFSAGNAGPESNTMGDYAAGPHVLSSAATADDTTVASFSSRGRQPSYSDSPDGANYDRERALRRLETYYSRGFADESRALASGTRTGRLGVAGLGLLPVQPPVSPPDTPVTGSVYETLEPSEEAGFLTATVGWIPDGADNDVYLHEGSKDGPVVTSSTGFVNANPETIRTPIEGGTTYFVEIRPFANALARYTLDFTFFAVPDEAVPDRPYGVHRPSVGTPGTFLTSTLSPDDAYQGYPALVAATTVPPDAAVLTEEQLPAAQRPFYGKLSGTSMSAPILTGICALVYDAYRLNHGQWPDPIDVINTIEATAVETREDYTVFNVGAGFADAEAAVRRAASGTLASFDEVSLVSDPDAVDQDAFVATGRRSDDGDAFTAGQTNHVTISIAASDTAVLRDRVPFDWAVVGGDHDRTYTSGGARYVEFTDVPTDGEVSYLIEAPDSPGRYTFGPAGARDSSGGDFQTITGTDKNTVVGVSQP